jgi:hypothetical protein
MHSTLEDTTTEEEEHVTVVVELTSVTIEDAFVPDAAAGAESIVRDEANRIRSTATDERSFFISD